MKKLIAIFCLILVFAAACGSDEFPDQEEANQIMTDTYTADLVEMGGTGVAAFCTQIASLSDNALRSIAYAEGSDSAEHEAVGPFEGLVYDPNELLDHWVGLVRETC